MLIALWILFYHIHRIISMECEYSSREYQVVLRPDLLANSFQAGVMKFIDVLAKIEDTKVIDFKVSRSSLKYKNMTIVDYTPQNSQLSEEFFIPIKFKSRQKKTTEPADIVMKISNADPGLSCVPLTVAQNYIDKTKIKFELDVHGENGRIRPQFAHSYTTDLSLDFDQTTAINLSSILIDAATKTTRSNEPIIIIPNSYGKKTLQTAEFEIRLAGQKAEAEIRYYRDTSVLQPEFSFRIKGATVQREILVASQQLISQLSQLSSIALYALIQPK
ncbi:unnamed protein product [Adineta steineri]|uniref:Uncharacterized protein n=2 Tax=Adineta steineri TaxID=433720 RepID=A0A813M7R2_9BILA|nr:unnamed protein product [Adineta steineri]CAF3733402.1 unnamed protein product [Adineta steineri]